MKNILSIGLRLYFIRRASLEYSYCLVGYTRVSTVFGPGIISSEAIQGRSCMRFKNRVEAGKQLAQALMKFQHKEGVIYALPRGGVPLGIELAKTLQMPLDLIIPRKVGHPFNPEYAIAAVGERGGLVCNEAEVERVDQAWFKQKVESERLEAQRRRDFYLKGQESIPVKGKVAILVDDGIATGLTMEAAIQDVKLEEPVKIVVAVPVAPDDTVIKLQKVVDEVVTLNLPGPYLGAVGAYYDDFNQVSDEEVIEMLDELTA